MIVAVADMYSLTAEPSTLYRDVMASSHQDIHLADAFVLLADSWRSGLDVIDTVDVLVQASTRFTSATDAGVFLADDYGVLHVIASSNERRSRRASRSQHCTAALTFPEFFRRG